MSQVFQEDWYGTDPFQDDVNYGTASSVAAFSNVPSEPFLDSNPYPNQSVYQESPIESFCDGAVASNAFLSSPTTPNGYPQDSVSGIPMSAIGVDAFGSTSLDSYQSQMNCDDNSFTTEDSEVEFSPMDSPLDSFVSNPFGEDSSKEEISFKEEVCQSAVPYSGEEEFEIEIEDSDIERAQGISEKKQKGLNCIVGQAVESGVAAAATSILSAYISPVAATAVVNTGMAAGKKVCFGITNRRAQKKTTESPYSPTAVADSVPSNRVPEQSCVSSSKKSSEVKTPWKEKGKEIGIEVGKELTRQICFGIEKRRKQKPKDSTGVGKASKHSHGFADTSLDYEPGDSGFGVKELLSEIDVAKIASTASSCLRKKAPIR